MIERRLTRERGMSLAEKLGSVSWSFVVLLGLMAGVGYAMLYSAAGGSPEPWAFRHGLRFGFGVLMMLAIAMVDIRIMLRLAWPLYLLGVGLLVLVALHGEVGKGAQRWLDLGGFQLQPSELMKILLVIALARWFHRASLERVGNPLFLVPPLIATAIPVALVLKQPNLGNALITLMVAGAVFFAAGVRWWKFALVIGAVAVAAPIVYESLHDYQRQRILTFLDPESDPLGAGYHVIQSKIALGAGGMFGRGFLQGTQSQLNFLPEKQTDFIFTMLAEEFGFVGAASVLALNLLVVLYGLAMALACRHQFGRLVAAGITVNFFLYVFVNIAMVMGMIPVGGVPLPLISHGGSAMITVLIGFGVLMSVHVHRAVEIEGEQGEV
ncbi:rod shape-determining protein RodA [Elioraea sp. Yellowstone]|jgi:rod shape determining protein RodA|uniref:rod shape-determining protein RodA n=1 Tax=Elioraea sp. Yellowstone TaxID=2592070 RepID=UPI001152EFA8|nr:rod shape-determining protein RodA [Elioraea sp. Yellowstone]TQF82224.1 rod shape-determining protein RodA [Elioraea sp. Yellowstone]